MTVIGGKRHVVFPLCNVKCRSLHRELLFIQDYRGIRWSLVSLIVPSLFIAAALLQSPTAQPPKASCPELIAGKSISVGNSPTRPACVTVSAAHEQALQ